MDPAKIEAIVTWPEPHNLKEVRSFVGWCLVSRVCTGLRAPNGSSSQPHSQGTAVPLGIRV